jgi:hypothetical protein
VKLRGVGVVDQGEFNVLPTPMVNVGIGTLG